MNRKKPKNPYERLLGECRQWAFEVMNPTRRIMFQFPKARLGEAWSLCEVKERVVAAKALGWGVEIIVDDSGDLVFRYVKNAPEAPWSIRP